MAKIYTGTFTPTDNLEDTTNVISVGTGWTDAALNAPIGSSNSANYTIDTKEPVITSITSNADSAGNLKIGDTITFTLTPSTTETFGVSGSYNEVSLTWAAGAGSTYVATYTVDNGDASHTTAIQITGVIITDAAGNPSAAANGSDVVKIIRDADAPAITIANPTTSPTQTKTITASVDYGFGAMTGMFINAIGVSTCDATLVFDDYFSITFSSEADNGKKVCYRAEDAIGNITYSLSNAISGIDRTPPIITRIGGTGVSYSYGSTYTDLGATATESAAVVTTGSVNPLVLGDYTLTYNATDTAGNAATSVTRLIHIIKADQTITFSALSDKVYGDTDFGLTATSTSGLTVALAASGGHCTIDGTTVHIVDVETCTITASQAGSTNYNGAPDVVRTFSITAKPITVTATAKTKVYGATDPTFTYVSSDLEAPLSGPLARANGANIGDYIISRGDLSAGSNYAITFVTANLTITAKPITVTAVAKSKEYGASDPAFTYTVSPALITGDAFTGALSRATGEASGAHAITQGTLSAGENYTITFVSANLTIGAAPTIVSNGGGTAISFCSNYVYSEWGTCTNGTQTRTIISKDGGSSCSTSNATLSQSCTVTIAPTVATPVVSTPVTTIPTSSAEILNLYQVDTTREELNLYDPIKVQLKTLNASRNIKLENTVATTYVNKNIDVKVYGTDAAGRITNFIVYGTLNNKYLSYNDRIDIINNFKKEFKRAPADEVEWTVTIGTANNLEDKLLMIKQQNAIKLNKEKITSPSKIKLYTNLEQIGGDLWGNKK